MPVVMIVLILAVEVFARPVPIRALGYEPRTETGGIETPQSSWIDRMFGGDGPLAEGPLNVLVLGVDTRPDDQEMGSRTDTIMLVQVVPKTGDIKLLSVPRDLLVEVEPGRKDRINAAYNYGGIRETLDVLQNYSGVPVDHYAIIDFRGFSDVIDAMGGVTVDVDGAVEFPEKWQISEGVQELDGQEALFYARYRHTERADLDRMQRQRELVAALRSQALSWNVVKTLPTTMEVMDKKVDTDLGFYEAVALGKVLIRKGKHAEMTSEQLQGTPRTLPNGDEVLLPDDKANQAILEKFRH